LQASFGTAVRNGGVRTPECGKGTSGNMNFFVRL